MSKPARFEEWRYLGDKRTLRVYDLEAVDTDPEVAAAVEAILAAETFTVFSPDTLAEARNRGYRGPRTRRRVARG